MRKAMPGLTTTALTTAAMILTGCGPAAVTTGSGPTTLPWSLVSASGREVNIQYGIGGCLHDPKITARESAAHVVITVRAEGRRAGQVCPAHVLYRTARVELTAPVGHRTILDGATGDPPRTSRAFPSSSPRT